jgi:hypothetical protein
VKIGRRSFVQAEELDQHVLQAVSNVILEVRAPAATTFRIKPKRSRRSSRTESNPVSLITAAVSRANGGSRTHSSLSFVGSSCRAVQTRMRSFPDTQNNRLA